MNEPEESSAVSSMEMEAAAGADHAHHLAMIAVRRKDGFIGRAVPGEVEAVAAARRVLFERRRRKQFLPAELFGEPAWDILLDLFASRLESKDISVSSACIASGVPPTTALRWLARLEILGLVERVQDAQDKRRVHVRLTSAGEDAVASWLRGTPYHN